MLHFLIGNSSWDFIFIFLGFFSCYTLWIPVLYQMKYSLGIARKQKVKEKKIDKNL